MSAVDLAPGTRVRHGLYGWNGTVDPDAVDARTRYEHPSLVPVQWDHDDASLTSAAYLAVVELEPAESAARPCRHEESMWGRCTACGMTWGEQARARAASAEVVVHPPSSQAGLAAWRYRLGGPVAEPAGPADHRG